LNSASKQYVIPTKKETHLFNGQLKIEIESKRLIILNSQLSTLNFN